MKVPTGISDSGTLTESAPAEASRRQVGWRDLAWITWRQHRLMLVGTAAVALLGAILMGLVSLATATRGSAEISVLMFDTLRAPANLLGTCVIGYSALVAVFWAAPLLSREYEQRTHLFAWSQDVAALRWLAGKTLVLGTVAIVLALLLGTSANVMLRQINATATDKRYEVLRAFGSPFFEAVPLVQVGYVLFGLALGLTISTLARRTVLSMGLTFGIFAVVRMVVAGVLRPYYMDPVREISPISASPSSGLSIPEQALWVEGGLVNGAGETVEFPDVCFANISDQSQRNACLREHGVVGRFRDYQPIERLNEFQLIEFGIFTILAVLLFLITWRLMRRATRR